MSYSDARADMTLGLCGVNWFALLPCTVFELQNVFLANFISLILLLYKDMTTNGGKYYTSIVYMP